LTSRIYNSADIPAKAEAHNHWRQLSKEGVGHRALSEANVYGSLLSQGRQ